jgi:VWFA-related protein
MSYRFSHKAVIAILIVAGMTLPSARAYQDDQVLRLETDLVLIEATVTDKDGNFIRDLKAEDFVIYEDGQQQNVDFFERNEETSLTRPLAVVFALDTSGSIKPEEVEKQREATEQFMQLVRPESLF